MRALVVSNMLPDAAHPERGRFVRDQVAALRKLHGFGGRAARVPARRAARWRGPCRAAPALRHAPLEPPRGRAGTVRRRPRALRPDRLARARRPRRVRALTVHGTDVRHPRTRLSPQRCCPADRPARRRVCRARCAELPGPGGPPARAGAALRRGPRALPARLPRAEARASSAWTPRAPICCSPPTPARRRSATTARSRSRDAVGVELLTLGGVEPERVPLWVNAANAVLVPSEREGFGLAVLEALACDVPVLATPVGIHRGGARAACDGALCAPFDLSTLARRAGAAPARGRSAHRGPRERDSLLRRGDGRACRRRVAQCAATIALAFGQHGPVWVAWIGRGSNIWHHHSRRAAQAAGNEAPQESRPPAGAAPSTEPPGFRLAWKRAAPSALLAQGARARLPRPGRAGLQPASLRTAQRRARARQADDARPHRQRAARAGRDATRAPAGHGPARGGHHRVRPLRGHSQQRRQLLPQLRAAGGAPRRGWPICAPASPPRRPRPRPGPRHPPPEPTATPVPAQQTGIGLATPATPASPPPSGSTEGSKPPVPPSAAPTVGRSPSPPIAAPTPSSAPASRGAARTIEEDGPTEIIAPPAPGS